MNLEQALAKIKELEDKIAAMSKDAPPAMADLTQKCADLETKYTALKLTSETAVKTAEKKEKFNVMLAEGKVCEAQRESFMSDDIVKFSENAVKTNLKPAGSEGAGATVKAEDTASAKVLKLSQEQKKSIHVILSENAELNAAYEKEVSTTN